MTLTETAIQWPEQKQIELDAELDANSLSDVVEFMAREKLPKKSTLGNFAEKLTHSFKPQTSQG